MAADWSYCAGGTSVRRRSTAARCPIFCRKPAIREQDWTVAPIPAGPAGPPRGNHRPGGAQDDNQRPELRRQRIHGRFGGLQLADLGTTWCRARSTCAMRCGGPSRFSTPTKEYRLNEKTAVLMVRPRGWHLVEKHVLVDGEPISASLFDFGLYFFHNAHELVRPRHGAVFLPAQAGKPPRSPAVERRVWLCAMVAWAAASASSKPRC